MKYSLRIYPDIAESVKKMSFRELLKTVSCPQTVADKGAMCVMPGHIALPSFDEKDPVMDLYPPATLSKPPDDRPSERGTGF